MALDGVHVAHIVSSMMLIYYEMASMRGYIHQVWGYKTISRERSNTRDLESHQLHTVAKWNPAAPGNKMRGISAVRNEECGICGVCQHYRTELINSLRDTFQTFNVADIGGEICFSNPFHGGRRFVRK